MFAEEGDTMEKIEIQLDEQTLARALKLAASRQCTLEDLIKGILEQMEVSETASDPFLGMFAHEPELIDQLIASTMMAREAHPLRQPDE